VLLVIFIITTTPIVNDLELDLPGGGEAAEGPEIQGELRHRRDQRPVYLNKEEVTIASLQDKLVGLRLGRPRSQRGNPRFLQTKYQNIVAVMDVLQQANVGKVNLATEPFADGPAKKE